MPGDLGRKLAGELSHLGALVRPGERRHGVHEARILGIEKPEHTGRLWSEARIDVLARRARDHVQIENPSGEEPVQRRPFLRWAWDSGHPVTVQSRGSTWKRSWAINLFD